MKEKVQFKVRTDLSIFIPHIFESSFIEILLKDKNILVGKIYRPNTYPQADLDIFSHTMSDLQNITSKENKDIFIMGDMNIDLLKCMTPPKTESYLDNTFAHGFWPLITKPTRLTSHSATLIDHIYTNKISSKVKSGIIISDVSDHFGIFTCIKTKFKYNTFSKYKNMRCFNEANITIFQNMISQTDFSPVLNSSSFQSLLTILTKLFP